MQSNNDLPLSELIRDAEIKTAVAEKLAALYGAALKEAELACERANQMPLLARLKTEGRA